MTSSLLQKLQGWRGGAAVFVAGASTPLAFAPLSLWPVAILGPALLFMLWLFATPRQAAWLGGLYGLGLFGTGIYWIFISVHLHGFVPLLMSLLVTGSLMALMAAYFALVGYAVARFFPRNYERRHARYKLLLVIPAAWVLGEWFRGWFLTGFPWLSLGYSQLDTALLGVAPILGVFGVSWLVALSAALLAALLLDRRKWGIYAAALALLWGSSALLKQIEWGKAEAESLTVTLLQGNIPQDLKWHPSVRKPTIDMYAELTRQSWGSDLVIWPETALPAFYYEVEQFLDTLEADAQEHDTDLLIGLLDRDRQTGNYYNSMVSLGSSRGLYHKQHLVPFTEYLPLKDLLGSVVRFIQVPMSDFSAGDSDQPLLAVAGHKVGISICFEDAFGEEVIHTLPEAGLLVNVSNDAWFDDSSAPPQHLQMARMRAAETARYMLRATNTGITAIVNERGEVVSRAPQFQVVALTGEVQPRSGATPYVVGGNAFVVLLAMAALGLAVWRLKPAPVRPATP